MSYAGAQGIVDHLSSVIPAGRMGTVDDTAGMGWFYLTLCVEHSGLVSPLCYSSDNLNVEISSFG